MTISHAASTGVSATTGARGTTSTTVAYVGVSAGRMGVLSVTVKPSTATLPTTVTDGGGRVWDRIADVTGGTGTNAADTGTSRIAKYVRIFDGTETGNVTITASNSPSQVCGAMDVYSTTAGGWQTPISVGGADTGHGTNPSATSGTWGSTLATGDWVNVGYGTDTDDSTAASGHNITQSGTTFGTVTARSRVGNSDGNDGSIFTWDAPVNSGGATSALTMSMTWAASSCGAFAAVRLREATTTAYTKTTVDAFPGTTIDTGSWDAWGGANITQNNQINLATSTSAGAYFGIGRLAAVDLASTPVVIRLVSMGNQALASYGAYLLNVLFSTDNEAYWVSYGNTLSFTTKVAGTTTQRYTMPYLTAMHLHYGIGFSGGNLVALWSRDGSNWVTAFSMANPYGGGDTDGTPYLMVGTDSAEASTTTLQLDDYGTLSGTTPVSQTLDARWVVYNEVGANLDARWAVANEVSSALDARWSVANEVASSLDARWAVLSTVSSTLDARWAVLSSVSQTLDARWVSRAEVSNALDARWRVSNTVSGDLDARWSVSAIVSQTLDARWRVSNEVSAALDARWISLVEVSNALDARWQVSNEVASALDARWSVSSTVSAALDARWQVLGLVESALDARWNSDGTAASVSSDLDARWRVANEVSSALDARWVSRIEVGNALDARWAVANAVSGALDARWAVLSTVTSSLDARWAVRAEVAGSLDARWRQFQEVANGLDIRWTSAGSVSSSIEARWTVSEVTSGTLDVRWAVRSGISSTLDARWLVLGLVAATLQALWNSAASEQPVRSDVRARLTDRFAVRLDDDNVVYRPADHIKAR